MGFVVQAGQKFAAITNMDTGNDLQNRAVGTTVHYWNVVRGS